MRSWLARGSTLWNTRFAIPQSLPRHLAGVNLASPILRVPPAVYCTLPFRACSGFVFDAHKSQFFA
jgi:hypothetical protein